MKEKEENDVGKKEITERLNTKNGQKNKKILLMKKMEENTENMKNMKFFMTYGK